MRRCIECDAPAQARDIRLDADKRPSVNVGRGKNDLIEMRRGRGHGQQLKSVHRDPVAEAVGNQAHRV